MLGDKRFLRTIRVNNLLSFGPDSPELELQSLNVLIGPNGSGKSNLIDVISILQAAPGNLFASTQRVGGFAEWIWKGPGAEDAARVEVTVSFREESLRHQLTFMVVGQTPELLHETIEHSGGMTARELGAFRQSERSANPPNQSILSQLREPSVHPQVTGLALRYMQLKLFRDWSLGRGTVARRPQQADLPGDFLQEDASNLALVLNDLEHRSMKRTLVDKLKASDEAVEDLTTKVLGGTVQFYLHYSGLKTPVPATRLSDGTVRYLCLLAILLHPEPPPLVCLEEPELGLHPDLMPGLADLLIDASHRMQLIVTTHSDVLVDGLTKVPEAVVVCEKRNGSTQMVRHSAAELSNWLKDYGLGQLWRSGEIGGNRW